MSRPFAYGNVLGGGLKLKGKAAPVARPAAVAASAALSARPSSSAAAGGAGGAEILAKSPSMMTAELTGSKRKFADSDAAKSSAADVAVSPDTGHKDKKRELLPPDDVSDAVNPSSGSVAARSSSASSSGAASKDGTGSASKALSRSGSAEAAASDAAACGAGAASGSSSSSAAAAAAAPAVDRRTAAQKAHDEALAKRREELARKAASKTHRERVNDLNHMLSTMTEHYDLFRISYAGTG